MEQYFMYQKAKLFDAPQVEKILRITTDVDTKGLQQTAANANVELVNEQILKLTADVASSSQTKLTEAQTKLTEAQTKLGEANQQKLNPTSIDTKGAVIILGKYAQLLGRKVQNYDDKRWEGVKLGHMLNGLRLKFTQNPELKNKLIATGIKTLYEANKFDDFWGIKFDIENAQKPENKSKYGKNMLGELLMVVRKELRPKS